MTKRIEIDPDDILTNDAWNRGFHEGGAGEAAQEPSNADYMRGWNKGRECYDEFTREQKSSPLSWAVVAGVICAAAYLAILAFKHITS